jgi:O-succinylbenzoate synthase
MKITGFEFFRFSVPLVRPLQVRGHTVAERDGLLVKLTSEQGRVGWGETSPLPGFSGEHVYEAAECLAENRARVIGHVVPGSRLDALWPEAWWNEWPPSVRMGLEMAVLDIVAAERGVRLSRLWHELPTDDVALNALVAGAEGLDEELARVKRAGFRAVKLKVGRKSVEDDAAAVLRARELLGTTVELRLDANRAWSWDDAVRFATLSKPADLSYIEEPLKLNERLPELAAKSGLPLALDETVVDTPSSVWLGFEGVKAVVLKPTLLGGLGRTARLARRASERGWQSVISSSFESGVALTALVQLAAAVGGGAAAGCDTYRWLKDDTVRPRLPLDRPVVDASALTWNTLRVNESLLHDVRHGRG